MEENKNNITIFQGIGFLVYISIAVVVLMVHLGFEDSKYSHINKPNKMHLNLYETIALCSGLGILSFILFNNFKNLLVATISGLIAGLSLFGACYLYYFFRQSIINYEILIPLFIGSIPGVVAYTKLDDWWKKKSEII